MEQIHLILLLLFFRARISLHEVFFFYATSFISLDVISSTVNILVKLGWVSWESFVGRHWPFGCEDCTAASKEGRCTVTLHNFLPREKKKIFGHKIRSDECEKLPFSLGGGWLLHTLVVSLSYCQQLFLFYWRERETRTAPTLFLSPFIFFILWGIRQEALVPPIKCRICLPGAEQGGDVALNMPHCTDPLHWGRAVESYAFEIKVLFPLYCLGFFFQIQQHGLLVGLVWVAH